MSDRAEESTVHRHVRIFTPGKPQINLDDFSSILSSFKDSLNKDSYIMQEFLQILQIKNAVLSKQI